MGSGGVVINRNCQDLLCIKLTINYTFIVNPSLIYRLILSKTLALPLGIKPYRKASLVFSTAPKLICATEQEITLTTNACQSIGTVGAIHEFAPTVPILSD